uniref:Cysteine-rich PDZ-binding protein n=1 Tax=Marmota marmota marmota TaxID=9994 RepID=A0A8C6EPG3_MARMA
LITKRKKITLGRFLIPDYWTIRDILNTAENDRRKLNENRDLTSKKARFDPYGKNMFSTCRMCSSAVHHSGSHYCQGCAGKRGICAMCGKRFWIPKTTSKHLCQCIDEVSIILLSALYFQSLA